VKKLSFILALLAVLILAALPVAAQGGLDPAAEPNFGNARLEAGFVPDPFVVGLSSGGDIDVSTLGLGDNCLGYATAAPDFRLTWSGQTATLRLFFVSNEDSTLIVNLPDGSWACNDDFSGLNPLVEVAAPAAGTYNIWIGSYNQGNANPGYLFITESNQSVPTNILSTVAGVFNSSAALTGGTLDLTAEPTFGEVNLAAGFTPDPQSIAVVSGGRVYVTPLNLGQGCLGYASVAPDYRINWSGSVPNLRVFFAGEGADTTLLIHTPDGRWLCNDDFSGFSPLVDITSPVDGTYNIWVGSFLMTNERGTLYITTQNIDQTNVQ